MHQFHIAPIVPLHIGDLDVSFGTGGLVDLDIGPGDEGVNAAVLAPGGEIVAAGSAAFATPNVNAQLLVVRLLADGAVDTTFGTRGIVTTNLPGDTEEFLAVAV